MKYTKEIMEKACIDAKSVAQVCRNLGLKPAGGNYRTVKSNLEKFGIDTEHETFNFGVMGSNPIPWTYFCLHKLLIY